MKFLIIAALVAVAAARPQEYHDDVFHFSTNVHHQNIGHSVVGHSAVPVIAKSVVVPQYQQQSVLVKSAPVYSQVVKSAPVYSQVVKSAPVYSQVQQVHQVVQQPSVLFRSVEQEIPAAVHTVHTEHVHQPVYSQVSSIGHAVVPAVAPVAVSRSAVVPQYNAQYNAQYNQYSTYSAEPKFKILKQVQEFDPVGIYRANYETENGISSAEQGTVKDIQAKEGPVAAKEGSYTYTGPDGVQYTVNWIADEFGYRASGAHLPVAPEVPAEIQRSLELIATQPQKYDDDGNLVAKF